MVRYVWEADSWPRWSWDSGALMQALAGVRGVQGRLLAKVDSLLPEDALAAAGEALIAETINNSAVEGELLDNRQVRSSVVRRLGLESAGLPEPRPREQAIVDVALEATQGHGMPLSSERLFSWQAALFPTGYSGLRMVRVGAWREEDPMAVVSGPVGREKVHYVAPPAERVPAEMTTFLDWWNAPPAGLDGLFRAALAHLWFVTIHPFEDGNGRLARVLTEMALSQDERRATRVYSLSSEILGHREEYYSALSTAQRSQGDATAWLLWFLTTLERSMRSGERAIEGVLLRYHFWKQHRLTPMNDRQRKALDRLLMAGPGGFEGGMTTRKYASLNRVSKPTAYRELSQLKELGILLPFGAGRSLRYEVNWVPAGTPR